MSKKRVKIKKNTKNIGLAKIQPNIYKKGINKIAEIILGLKINIFRYVRFSYMNIKILCKKL